jgi:hypothetical protein
MKIIEPTWQSARSVLIGLPAYDSRRMYQVLKEPVRPITHVPVTLFAID